MSLCFRFPSGAQNLLKVYLYQDFVHDASCVGCAVLVACLNGKTLAFSPQNALNLTKNVTDF